MPFKRGFFYYSIPTGFAPGYIAGFYHAFLTDVGTNTAPFDLGDTVRVVGIPYKDDDTHTGEEDQEGCGLYNAQPCLSSHAKGFE